MNNRTNQFCEEIDMLTNSLMESISDAEFLTDKWNVIDRFMSDIEQLKKSQPMIGINQQDEKHKYTWDNYERKDCWNWNHGLFESMEDCMKDAKENCFYEAGDTIVIGEAVKFLPTIDSDNILENMTEQACDECGECGESWPDCSREDAAALSERLTECVHRWLKETNNEADFYQVINISTIKIN